MRYNFTIDGKKWTIAIPSPLGLRVAAGTTMGATTRFEGNGKPDSSTLAHEWYHVLHTNWFLYLLSCTVGRLIGSTYWKEQEIGANAYQVDPVNIAKFTPIAAELASFLPATWRTVHMSHPV